MIDPVPPSQSSLIVRPLSFDLAGCSFVDLNVRRDPATQTLIFEPSVLRRLLQHNHLQEVEIAHLSETALYEIVLAWYVDHLARGGWVSQEASAAVGDALAAATP